MTDWSYTLLVDSYESLNVYQSTGSKYHYHDLNTYLKDLKKKSDEMYTRSNLSEISLSIFFLNFHVPFIVQMMQAAKISTQ